MKMSVPKSWLFRSRVPLRPEGAFKTIYPPAPPAFVGLRRKKTFYDPVFDAWGSFFLAKTFKTLQKTSKMVPKPSKSRKNWS